jgi:membrane-associated phospholipid phosphatase
MALAARRSDTARDGAQPATVTLRLVAGVSVTLLNAFMYLIANHFPMGPPRLLPWTAWDAAVPFVPQTVWLYFTDYFLVPTAFLRVRTIGDVRRLVLAFVVMHVLGCAVHIGWPTTFPRELYPADGPGLATLALSILRAIDQPTSCLPSMHVAGSFLAAFALWRHPSWQWWTWMFWAWAIALSTLTTKQHYAVDLVSGVALAATMWLVFIVRPAWRAEGAVEHRLSYR